jgi:hypothetical protein
MTIEKLSPAPAANTADVVAAIKTASRETGSDFDYLLATAQRESNLDSKAKSKSSSATGLFQFLDQTWLSLIKRYGNRHGLGHYVEAITKTESGRLAVGSAGTKSAIRALREDPEISALMAGEAASATRQSLECALGRPVCSGELYAAHFLGDGGARRLINLNAKQSDARADLAFPEAAKANRSVFYHSDGRAKTVGEVHAWAVGKTDPALAPVQKPTVVAAASTARAPRGLMAPDAASSPITRNDAEESFGITVRGSRFVFSGPSNTTPASAEAALLPRSPLALSAGVLEILAALTSPSLVRRHG